jgi:hypothetical protein
MAQLNMGGCWRNLSVRVQKNLCNELFFQSYVLNLFLKKLVL